MSFLIQLSQMVASTSTRNGSLIGLKGLSKGSAVSTSMSSPSPPPSQDSLIFTERISPSVKDFLVSKPISRPVLFILLLILIAIPALIVESKWKKKFVAKYDLKEDFLLKIVASLATILAVALWSIYRSVRKESVMFILSVGVQVKKFNVLGRTISTRFFPRSKIKALVINETIRRQRVVTYLALILNSPDENGRIIIPLFDRTLPRLSLLSRVYRESYALLDT